MGGKCRVSGNSRSVCHSGYGWHIFMCAGWYECECKNMDYCRFKWTNLRFRITMTRSWLCFTSCIGAMNCNLQPQNTRWTSRKRYFWKGNVTWPLRTKRLAGLHQNQCECAKEFPPDSVSTRAGHCASLLQSFIWWADTLTVMANMDHCVSQRDLEHLIWPPEGRFTQRRVHDTSLIVPSSPGCKHLWLMAGHCTLITELVTSCRKTLTQRLWRWYVCVHRSGGKKKITKYIKSPPEMSFVVHRASLSHWSMELC